MSMFRGQGFPSGSAGEQPTRNAGDTGDSSSIPGWGRSLGEGNGNPPQYSCLGNSMDRGACQATDHGITKSWTRLSEHTHTCRGPRKMPAHHCPQARVPTAPRGDRRSAEEGLMCSWPHANCCPPSPVPDPQVGRVAHPSPCPPRLPEAVRPGKAGFNPGK